MHSAPEVVVVGGGPGGAAAAYWLARHGHHVMLVEKREYPRAKTCGDGLTPRAIRELLEMGLDFSVPGFHRCKGLRAVAGNLIVELEWPEHQLYPNWGGVMRRSELDAQLGRLVEGQGAVVRQGTVARPVLGSGGTTAVALVGGGETEVVTPQAVVVADGALSRFGRALGTRRDRRLPFGLGVRGYFTSPRSDDGFLESYLDLRQSGSALPGYGWVFPLGDGTVNVGVGVISTFHRWKEVNTSALLDLLVATADSSWGLSAEGRLGRPTGGILPMSFSVGPLVGANWVLVGDAAGAVNPFNGEGIAYALETGRAAARHLSTALAARDLTLLKSYRQEMADRYGLYYRVGRAFVRLIGRPGVMRLLTRTGLRSRPLMEWVMRVMANLLDPADRGVGLAAYRVLERIVQMRPEP
jgi:geranylgeranyl reductase family protein